MTLEQNDNGTFTIRNISNQQMKLLIKGSLLLSCKGNMISAQIVEVSMTILTADEFIANCREHNLTLSIEILELPLLHRKLYEINTVNK